MREEQTKTLTLTPTLILYIYLYLYLYLFLYIHETLLTRTPAGPPPCVQHRAFLSKMPFAQLVIGAPGAGKSTYCDGMQQFLTAMERKCTVVNLDPANDRTNYDCAVDIRDLVSLEKVMEEEELGPNGGVLYAFEELEENWDWFEEELRNLSGTWRNKEQKYAWESGC